MSPSVRRNVKNQQRGECAVPGCHCRAFMHGHHKRPRIEGGSHDEENIVFLCSAHHGAVHRGTLVLREVEGELVFEHADGVPYGNPRANAARCELLGDAYLLLVEGGYFETEARNLLDRVRTAVRDWETVDDLVQRATQRDWRVGEGRAVYRRCA